MKTATIALFVTASAAAAHPGHPVVATGTEGHALSHTLIGLVLVGAAVGVWLVQHRRSEG